MTRMDPRIAARRREVQESRARRSLRRIVRLLVVGAAGAGLWWLITSPLFSVADVSVSGATETPVAELVAGAGAGPGTPLIRVDTAAVEAALLDHRWVLDAEVTRTWPNGLTVSIDERVPVVQIQTTDEVLTVAVDGVVLRTAEAMDRGALPVIDGRALQVGDPAADPDMRSAVEFLAALGPELGLGATGYFGPEGLVARVAGFDVRVGGPGEEEEKAEALRVILATRPEEGSVITVVSADRPAVLPPGTDVESEADTEAPEE